MLIAGISCRLISLCFFLALLRGAVLGRSSRGTLPPHAIEKRVHNCFDAVVRRAVGCDAQAVASVLSVLHSDFSGLQVSITSSTLFSRSGTFAWKRI